MTLLFEEPYKYVLDSCALFDLKNKYPPNVFVGLWANFNNLCNDLKIISVREVYREIEIGLDWLKDWAADNDKIFFEPRTKEEFEFIGDLQERNPSWIDPNSTRPIADPFIISCAYTNKLIIITQESKNSLLPKIAKHHNVACMTLLEFFENEGWKF